MRPDEIGEKIIETNQIKEELEKLIYTFYSDKTNADKYKKLADASNLQIKDNMKKLNATEFETESGLIAKIGVQNKESFDEDKLINKLKILNALSCIKTKEYVDMDELENLIYNGHIDAGQLSNCKINKQTITLTVKQKKGN